MAKRRLPEGDTEINITPMLDVVFIMLIFFIVNTSFIKETGIDVNRPDAAQALPKPLGNILIAVSDGGKVWMQKKQIGVDQVRQMVERAKAESPEASVVIIPDRHAPTGVVIDVMEQVSLGGIRNIAIAAQQSAGS